jgi:hypothetical protein
MANSALFVLPPAIDPLEYFPQGKFADARMSSSPAGWTDEVLQNLMREQPYIPPDRVMVNFRQRDDAQGTALGYVSITGAPRISIPVIIRHQMLSPFDTFIVRKDSEENSEQAVGNFTDDRVLPLNESTFTSALDLGDIGEPVQSMEIRGSGWTEDGSGLRLPYRGRTVVAHVMGATAAKKAELDVVLKSDRAIVAGFAINNPEILDFWLAAPAPGDAIRAKLASAEVTPVTIQTLHDLPVEKNVADIPAASIWVEPGATKIGAVCNCMSLANPLQTAPYLVFEDGNFCLAPLKVAVAVSGRGEQELMDVVWSKLATRQFVPGDWVMFLVNGNFTEPAKVASVALNQQTGFITMSLQDGMGVVYPAAFGTAIKEASVGDNGGWILPMSTLVLRLTPGTDYELPMDPGKVASVLGQILPHRLMHEAGQFFLRLGDDQTLAVDGVDEIKCAEVLRKWFTNADLLIQAAKTSEAGIVRFSSNICEVLRDFEEKTARYRAFPKDVDRFVRELAMPMKMAAKLASALSDPDGVDSILASGFLTEDNLAEFSGLASTFEDTVGKLARLLLLIRMGYPEGDESATMVAMKSLQRVTESLRGMSSTNDRSL